MSVDIMLPNGRQMDDLLLKSLQPKSEEIELKISPSIQVETLVSSGTVELGDPLANRNRMVVRNLDSVRTARIGGSGITEKVGYLLEPMQELTILFDTSAAVSVYGRATGAELKVEVIES
jgi:hypothetical protein